MKKFLTPPGCQQSPSIIPNDKLWNWVKANIKQTRNAVDVGGHVGTMSYRMSSVFDHVHTFEPAFHEWTIKNLEECNNVTVYPYGLGDENRDDEMFIMERKTGGSSLVATERRKLKWINENTPKQQIKLATLDSFDFHELDFIKIDVESYEYFVIDGAKETLKRESPMIMIEMLRKYDHPTHGAMMTRGLLESLGYCQVMDEYDDYIFIKR